MVRGVDRTRIFLDDQDRARFLFRLEEAVRMTGLSCFAWALMPNHVHLQLRTGPTPLAVGMHRLGTSYASDFNRRHNRTGHLFQNRYKALVVESDAYDLELLRYIHLNPLRAGILPDLDALEDHPWTGHRTLMGRGRARFQAVEEVLHGLGATPAAARLRLREWMEAGVVDPARRGTGGLASGTVPEPSALPVPVGREGVLLPAAGGLCPRSLRADVLHQAGWDLRRLVRWVCAATGVAEEDLASGRRTRDVSRARAVIAWFAWTDLQRGHDSPCAMKRQSSRRQQVFVVCPASVTVMRL